jgi:hypothetical protein
MKAYYIIRRARKKRAMKIVFSLSLSLFLSLCIYKAKHNDLNYVHSTLIKEGKEEEEEEEEEAFSCRSRRRSKSVIQIETAKWKSERASNNNNNNNNNNNSYSLFIPSNGN